VCVNRMWKLGESGAPALTSKSIGKRSCPDRRQGFFSMMVLSGWAPAEVKDLQSGVEWWRSSWSDASRIRRGNRDPPKDDPWVG